ncbi:MAG: PhzF family phenazine biosynthesis protein [Hyphomicrobiales bacterium]|nr:PhzF family phenazine biosynthesis protein [Hyphomicrobiales bacterium]
MKRKYFTLDVFTQTPLGGNPLAVVLDSEGLDDAAMQAIAGEFNLSETVFASPATTNENRANIRIFTPKRELPFAGHPTVGTAILLAKLGGLESGYEIELVLEEKVGLVPCKVSCSDGLFHGGFELPKLPQMEPLNLDATLLSRATGIRPDQFGISGHHHSICNAGVAFPTVAVADLSAIEAIKIDEDALAKCFESTDVAAEIFVYTKQCVHKDSDYHVRMFAPAFGITEDPATGSAAASFGAQIMAYEKPVDGDHTYVIEQGFEMGRPSCIELSLKVEKGLLKSAGISGSAVIVSEGTLYI